MIYVLSLILLTVLTVSMYLFVQFAKMSQLLDLLKEENKFMGLRVAELQTRSDDLSHQITKLVKCMVSRKTEYEKD